MQGSGCPCEEPTHLNLGSIGTGAMVAILLNDNVCVAMRQKTARSARLDQQTRDSELQMKLALRSRIACLVIAVDWGATDVLPR